MAYGYQLLLDLYGCNGCDDLELCYRFLDEIVSHIGVRKQAPPSIFLTDAFSVPKHEGLTGWVPLIESSVVIHTHVPDRFISIDLYSCKPFDYDEAVRFSQRFFNPDRVDSQQIIRGRQLWNSEPRKAEDQELNSTLP